MTTERTQEAMAEPNSLEEKARDFRARFEAFKELAKSRKFSKGLINYLFGLLEIEGESMGAQLSARMRNPERAAIHVVNAEVALWNIGIGRYVAEGNSPIKIEGGEEIRIIPGIQDLKFESNRALYQYASDRYNELRLNLGLA